MGAGAGGFRWYHGEKTWSPIENLNSASDHILFHYKGLLQIWVSPNRIIIMGGHFRENS